MTADTPDNVRTTLAFYDANSPKLADQYATVKWDQVLAGLELPELRALDVACGTGRDAKGLAESGFRVDAVDGSAEMINRARERNSHPKVNYGVDVMPDLASIRAQGHKYDLITMSAAWMHLDETQRWRMFRTLMDVSKPGTRIFITLRHGATDPLRPMYDVNAQELMAMAAGELVSVTHHAANQDKLGRGNVWWDSVTLNIPKTHVEALPVFRDSIIRSSKSTTYKLGLAHCLTKLLREDPKAAVEIDDARCAVPLAPILAQWARLYEGLAQAGLYQIRSQERFGNTLDATRRFTKAATLVTPFDLQPGRVFEGVEAEEVQRMLAAARKVIVNGGPVEHITRRDGGMPVFTYQRPTIPALKAFEIGSPEFDARFGRLIMAKDVAAAAGEYSSLIDAGVRQEWVNFTAAATQLTQADAKPKLEQVLAAA